jgi:hypothetical protein
VKNIACPGQPPLEIVEAPRAWFAVMVDGRLRPERYTARPAADAAARQRARYAPTHVAAVVEVRALAAYRDPYFSSKNSQGSRPARDAADILFDSDPPMDSEL